MTTISILEVIVLAFAVGFLIYRAIPAVRAYSTYRGKRLVTCPETRQTEAIDVAARKAAVETFVGRLHLTLSDCSRWPERQNCGQACLKQVEADPENCLVWNIVSK